MKLKPHLGAFYIFLASRPIVLLYNRPCKLERACRGTVYGTSLNLKQKDTRKVNQPICDHHSLVSD